MKIHRIGNSVGCKLRANWKEIKDEMTLSSDLLKSREKQKIVVFLAYFIYSLFLCTDASPSGLGVNDIVNSAAWGLVKTLT